MIENDKYYRVKKSNQSITKEYRKVLEWKGRRGDFPLGTVWRASWRRGWGPKDLNQWNLEEEYSRPRGQHEQKHWDRDKWVTNREQVIVQFAHVWRDIEGEMRMDEALARQGLECQGEEFGSNESWYTPTSDRSFWVVFEPELCPQF